MKLGLGWVALCSFLLVGCTTDGPDHDGADASTDGAASVPSDAGSNDAGQNHTVPDAAMDSGPGDARVPDAMTGSDAGDAAACFGELDCTGEDCMYQPDYDLSGACNTESSYVIEGTCGEYRYRATGDGFVGGVRYYRIDTGVLVATMGYSDEAACQAKFGYVQGDLAVVKACEIEYYTPDNLCCATENGSFITFCDEGDGGA